MNGSDDWDGIDTYRETRWPWLGRRKGLEVYVPSYGSERLGGLKILTHER